MRVVLLVFALLFGLAPASAQTYPQFTRSGQQSLNQQTFYGCGTGCITGTNLNNYFAILNNSVGFLSDMNAWIGPNSFSISPTAPTITICSDSTTKLATTGFVQCAVGSGAGLGFPKTVSGVTTSGGVPYFSNATTLSSSGVLATNRLLLGGGAGNPPSALGSLGTATTVLHGNASGSPSFSSIVLSTDVSGILPIANGGNGTASPALVAGSGISIAGTWPNQTVTSTVTGVCPPSVFCVSNYANVAAAFTAVAANGGGEVFFPASVTLSAAQSIQTPGVTVRCAGQSVVIATSSSTADLLDITGDNFVIENCTLAYTGTAQKTAGNIINTISNHTTISNVHVGPDCFTCFLMGGTIGIIHAVSFDGNSTAQSASSSVIIEDNQILHMTDVTEGASTSGSFYENGIYQQSGALDGVNIEMLTTNRGLIQAPGSGQSVFAFVSDSYFDTCGQICLYITPLTGGAVGEDLFDADEFGTDSSTVPAVDIDTATGGGNVGVIKIINSNIYSYVSDSGNCINLLGSLGDIDISHNTAGSNCVAGFATNSGVSTLSMRVIGNSFHGSTDAIFLSGLLPEALIQLNNLNGNGASTGGNTSPNYANNLP